MRPVHRPAGRASWSLVWLGGDSRETAAPNRRRFAAGVPSGRGPTWESNADYPTGGKPCSPIPWPTVFRIGDSLSESRHETAPSRRSAGGWPERLQLNRMPGRRRYRRERRERRTFRAKRERRDRRKLERKGGNHSAAADPREAELPPVAELPPIGGGPPVAERPPIGGGPPVAGDPRDYERIEFDVEMSEGVPRRWRDRWTGSRHVTRRE